MKKGFTLIELLVVVLIIGILAAIALPQYKSAVERTKYALSQQMTRSLADAAERYYLANGKYATNFDDLDITLPGTYTPVSTTTREYSWGRCSISSENVFCLTNQPLTYYQIYHKYSNGRWVPAGSKVCVAYGTNLNNVGNRLCKRETQRSTYRSQSNSGGYYNNGYTEWLYPAGS